MTYRLTRRQAIAGLARAGAVAVLPLDAIAAAEPAPPAAVRRGSIVALPPLEAVIEPEPALPTAGTTARPGD
jgi:hypothetical protein